MPLIQASERVRPRVSSRRTSREELPRLITELLTILRGTVTSEVSSRALFTIPEEAHPSLRLSSATPTNMEIKTNTSWRLKVPTPASTSSAARRPPSRLATSCPLARSPKEQLFAISRPRLVTKAHSRGRLAPMLPLSVTLRTASKPDLDYPLALVRPFWVAVELLSELLLEAAATISQSSRPVCFSTNMPDSKKSSQR
jgi:hypothetical protein